MLGRGDDVEVGYGVDLLPGKHPGDDRTAKVDADKLGAAEIVPRRNDVDTEHPVDVRIGGEKARETAPEVAGDTSDQYDARHYIQPPAASPPTSRPHLKCASPRGTETLLLPQTPALNARLLEELAVLLLRHSLTTLLDDRTHAETFRTQRTPTNARPNAGLSFVNVTCLRTRWIDGPSQGTGRWICAFPPALDAVGAGDAVGCCLVPGLLPVIMKAYGAMDPVRLHGSDHDHRSGARPWAGNAACIVARMVRSTASAGS